LPFVTYPDWAHPGQAKGPGGGKGAGGAGKAPAGPPASKVYKTSPTLNDLVTDPLVDYNLKKAFTDSNPNAPNVPAGTAGSLKKEQGGWIVWDKKTGSLEVTRVPAGTRDGLGPIVGTRPADTADKQTVGWFHTHPNKSAEGYTSGPSPGDRAWQNSEAKVPGIIETHDGRKTIPYP
jgi:hypothetical protein